MDAIYWVIHACMVVSDWFYYVYLETSGWWWPLHLVSGLFLWISDSFIALASHFGSFALWVMNADNWFAQMLREWDLWRILTIPISWAESAWNWVADAFWNVWNIVTDWWGTVWPTVQGWIDIAVEGFNRVKTEWDNFWSQTFPNLLDWFKLENWWSGKIFGIDGLIGSKLAEWFPWYDALAQSIDGILTFFTDPAKAVYELFDYIIDRFWEDTPS